MSGQVSDRLSRGCVRSGLALVDTGLNDAWSTVVGGNCFDRDQVEAEVADPAQESVELTLVEGFGHETGLAAPRFNRYARKCGVESCA